MSVFLTRWASLYTNQTPAERALEPAIASLAIPYRCQHPIWSLHIFPDFVLPQHKVVIEVDDPSHFTAAKRKKDEEKTQRLSKLGWRVVRVTNKEVLADPYAALSRLLDLPELRDLNLKIHRPE